MTIIKNKILEKKDVSKKETIEKIIKKPTDIKKGEYEEAINFVINEWIMQTYNNWKEEIFWFWKYPTKEELALILFNFSKKIKKQCEQ